MSTKIQLTLKPYIQPFEKYLANAELSGLLGNGNKNPFEAPSSSQISITPSVPIKLLTERLAYWEKIKNNKVHPTLQVLIESEQSKQNLEIHNSFSYHRSRKLRYGPHGIHEYRGKFFPQLVKSLINFSGLPSNSIVLDPMCGSGTTNCEARSMGMRTLGLDLNPLSVKITEIKTAIFDLDQKNLIATIELLINRITSHDVNCLKEDSVWDEDDVRYLMRWFDPLALREISAIIQMLRSSSDDHLITEFMEVSLSNIVRNISWQRESDLRVRKQIEEYKPGEAKNLFINELQDNLKKTLTYLSWFDGTRRFPKYSIQEGDARLIEKSLSHWAGKCDCIITSPPYATALPYIDTDRLSLILLGLLPRSDHRNREYKMIGNREVSEKQRQELWQSYLERRKELPFKVRKIIETIAISNHTEEVGFRRRNLPSLLAKYFLDMTDAMYKAKRMLKPNANAFYIVGNNSTTIDNERYEIDTDIFLWEIAKRVGWKQKKMINMELLHSRDIFRLNRGTAESILWLQA